MSKFDQIVLTAVHGKDVKLKIVDRDVRELENPNRMIRRKEQVFGRGGAYVIPTNEPDTDCWCDDCNGVPKCYY